MKFIGEYIATLYELTEEMAPWLLLGFLVSGILKVVLPQRLIHKWMGKPGFMANFKAALFGIPLPLCSCGVIPAGVALHRFGASKGAVNSFLIATPQTGVDSVFATYALMGWPFAVLRPVIAFVTGILGGGLTDTFVKGQRVPVETSVPTSPEGQDPAPKGIIEKLRAILRYGFVEMVADIAKWLVVGLLLAGLIAMVPESFFARVFGNTYLEFLAVLGISIPLYVCATGSIPIAMVLLIKGMSPGAALLFLMAGPATNVATITVIGKALGQKTLWAYLASIIGGALVFSVAVNLFVPREWIMQSVGGLHGAHGGMFPHWVNAGLAITLLILLAYGLFGKFIGNAHKTKNMKTLDVTGMSCNHCKLSVEKNVGRLKGVVSITADPEQDKVFIDGDVDLAEVGRTLADLGYTLKD